MSEILTHELTIRAPARIVYELLTDSDRFAEWMAVEAELQAWPGGLAHPSRAVAAGRRGPRDRLGTLPRPAGGTL